MSELIFNKYKSLNIVDNFNDFGKIQSIKYSKEIKIHHCGDDETVFLPNSNILLLDISNFSLVNELTWKINGEISVAMSAYYPLSLTNQFKPKFGTELIFYTSTDRINWKKVNDITIHILNSNLNENILFLFWIEKTPKYTQYIKVQIPALGQCIYISELRSSGGKTAYNYYNVYSDMMDSNIKADNVIGNVCFNDNVFFDMGIGEISDYRRVDGRMGVIHANCEESTGDLMGVVYTVPTDTRLIVETYLHKNIWKVTTSEIIMTGELRDELKPYGTFELQTQNPQTNQWENIQTTMQVYHGFAVTPWWTYGIRDYDKVIYCIDKITPGHTKVRILFPNYNHPEVGVDIRGNSWISHIKSIHAQIPNENDELICKPNKNISDRFMGTTLMSNLTYNNNGKPMNDNDGPAYLIKSSIGYNRASVDIALSELSMNLIRTSDAKTVSAYLILGMNVYSMPNGKWVNCCDTGITYKGNVPGWHLFYKLYSVSQQNNTWYESSIMLNKFHNYRIIVDSSNIDGWSTVYVIDLSDNFRVVDSITYESYHSLKNGSNSDFYQNYAIDFPDNVKIDTSNKPSRMADENVLYNTNQNIYIRNLRITNATLSNYSVTDETWTESFTTHRVMWPDNNISKINYPLVIVRDASFDNKLLLDFEMNC